MDVDSWVKDFDEPPFDETDPTWYLDYLAQLRQSEITVQVLIDSNNYIKQLKTDVFLPYDDPETGVRKWGSMVSIITYSSFNEDIRIARPV